MHILEYYIAITCFSFGFVFRINISGRIKGYFQLQKKYPHEEIL